MPQIKFEKAKLDELLASVGNELTEMLKAEQAALAKSATDDAPSEESEGSSGPAAPDAGGDDSAPEASAEDAGPPAEASSDAGPPEASESQAQAASAPDGSPQHEAGEIEPAPTVEELQAEYAKLDPEALKMHYLAAKSALMAVMGADQGAGPEASAPGAGAPPPAAPPAPAPAAGAPMAMGERSAKAVDLSDGGIGGEIEKGKMSKAEKDELLGLRKQVEEQNKALLQLAEVVATPIRKSVKGLSDLRFIERTEAPQASVAAKMSPSEIKAVLRDKIRDGKLTKSDKELVAQYTVGTVDVSKIEHLLASAK